MPEMDGFEVLAALKKEPIFSQVPTIVMFSSSDTPSDVQKSLELGADAYQTKPMGMSNYLVF
jgi:CheY-like chemotaxis protein